MMTEGMADAASDSGTDIAPVRSDLGELKLALCNSVVRLHKQHFGKGPTKARAYYDGDVVTVVLRDVYTRAELTLLGGGREASVLRQRWELQEVVRNEFIAEVERLVGREVIGFFSGNQAEPDMSVEVFVLGETNGAS